MLYEWLAPWKLWGVVVFAPTAGWIRDCWKNQHRYHKYLDPYKHKQQQYMGNRWFKCCITKALPEFFWWFQVHKNNRWSLPVGRTGRTGRRPFQAWMVSTACMPLGPVRMISPLMVPKKCDIYLYRWKGLFGIPKSLWISICSYGMLWNAMELSFSSRSPKTPKLRSSQSCRFALASTQGASWLSMVIPRKKWRKWRWCVQPTCKCQDVGYRCPNHKQLVTIVTVA